MFAVEKDSSSHVAGSAVKFKEVRSVFVCAMFLFVEHEKNTITVNNMLMIFLFFIVILLISFYYVASSLCHSLVLTVILFSY